MGMRLWIDEDPASIDSLATVALVNYGHFTSMQVRDGCVRGLARHLLRVDAAHRELFGHSLDRGRVQAQWSNAAAQQTDAYLRATFYDDAEGVAHALIVLRDPVEPAAQPQRLRTVQYIRPFAHLKHVGTFAQIRHGEEAERAGWDDALLVTAERQVAETTTANLGFILRNRVIWPSAPALHGIGQQLITEAATSSGMRVAHMPVGLDALDTFDAAFTINSVGLVPVAQIDEHRFDMSREATSELVALHHRLPWDRLVG